ncbi:MAG: ligand-binding sensor domain-containing protein, partial [Chitinophagaceae bacterium]
MPFKYYVSFLSFLIALLLFCFLVPPSFGQSQSFPFKHFPLPKDLPPIIQMYEDHLGYIWLATAEGLYRFDGIHFIYYTGTNPGEGLGREAITHITEDRENNLWVGARSGLYKYNVFKNDFDKFSFGDEVYAYYIHQENDSCFVVHTVKGIYLFYPDINRWDKLDVGIPDQKIFNVLRGLHNDLWIGTDFILKKYDLQKRTAEDFKLPRARNVGQDEKISVNHLFLDSRHQLWINTWFKGVIKLNTLTGDFELFDTNTSTNQNVLLGLFNPSMTEDSDGNIWMASYASGISIYHHLTGIISHIPRGTDIRFGLVGSDFQIMTDRKKNIWVKSEIALHYLNAKSPVPFLKSDLRNPLHDALFIKFLQPDFALIGTFFGLYGVNTKTKQVIDLSRVIQLPTILSAELQSVSDVLEEDENLLWFTTPQGLRKVKYSVNEENHTSFHLEKIFLTRTDFWASKIAHVNDSILMVKGRTNTNVIATFNKRTEKFEYHEFADTFFINQAIQYKNDTLLLCVRNQGLYKYHVGTRKLSFVPWNMKQGDMPIRKPVFLNIISNKNGTYSLCTENYGLILFDPKNNVFDHVDVVPISNTNIVYAVNEDTEHNLWIQTSNQLLYYDIKTEALAQTALSNSFKGYNPGYFMHANNDLYCTFEGGLYQIEYTTLFTKTTKPKLYLQKIKAGSQVLDWLSTNPIRLSYSDNFLSYEYIGLDYDNPQGLR